MIARLQIRHIRIECIRGRRCHGQVWPAPDSHLYLRCRPTGTSWPNIKVSRVIVRPKHRSEILMHHHVFDRNTVGTDQVWVAINEIKKRMCELSYGNAAGVVGERNDYCLTIRLNHVQFKKTPNLWDICDRVAATAARRTVQEVLTARG